MANEEFQCQECGAKFNDEASLARHHRMVHSDSGYVCNECGMRFDSEAELEAHNRAVHPEHQRHPTRTA